VLATLPALRGAWRGHLDGRFSAPANPALSYIRELFRSTRSRRDQSFVRGHLGRQSRRAGDRASIVSIGIGLGVTITAEGVRDTRRAELPAARGRSRGTGFMFRRGAAPMTRSSDFENAQCARPIFCRATRADEAGLVA